MRKLLATVLAVVMLACVFAAIPASAATFDKSTAADVPDLIATEIMPNPDDNADYFEFIEFYNRGETDVNFYDLALVRAPDFQIDSSIGQDNPYYSYKYMWGQQRKFQAKVDINAGELAIPAAADVTLLPGVTFTNPASGIVAPHSFAIIWVVNKNTVSKVNEASVDYDPVPADLPIRLFRERFDLPNDFNVPIFYIWGDSALAKNGNTTTIKTDEFELTDCSNTKYENFMLGLVDKSFALSESVYSSNTFNAKVKTLFGYGVKQAMSYNGKQNTCTAFTYVPADQLPVVANRKKDKSDENATDYVTGNYVESYRQAGMADGLTTPTPGTMPAYQWYYVDAANAPASVKGTDPDWGPNAVQAWVTAVAGPEGGIDADYNDPNQVVIEVNPPTQEELNEKFFGGDKKSSGKKANAGTTADDTAAEGLPTGALIGIIAGGVVLAAAIVVAVIIVIKKKKAAPAVEEAPAEEAEAPTEEAPAEEAPAEEAPAEEENKEE